MQQHDRNKKILILGSIYKMVLVTRSNKPKRFSDDALTVSFILVSGDEYCCFIHLEKIMPQAGQLPASPVSVSIRSWEHLGQVVYIVIPYPRAVPQFQQSVN